MIAKTRTPGHVLPWDALRERVAQYPPILIGLLVFIAALLPRVLPVGSFVTIDEAYHWFDRAQIFLRALEQGNYAATNQVGHPGVTTMWLGAIGAKLHASLIGLGLADPDNAALGRFFLRVPIGVASSLIIVAAYSLLRRLWGGVPAIVAALLWAGEPFLAAHAQLLHVDALVSGFITLALLLALVAWRVEAPVSEMVIGTGLGWGWVVLAGVVTGLALLTKSPALILLPTIGLIACWRARAAVPLLGGSAYLRLLVLPLIVLVVVAAATWVLLWPAAWVDLPMALQSVILQVEGDGAVPHAWGNFFLGHAVDDPGPLFYPVVLALRLSPWAWLGVFAAGYLIWQRPTTPGTNAACWLLLFVVLFSVAISIPPKKFDRYLLPIFPALACVAGWGFARLITDWHRWLHWAQWSLLGVAVTLTLLSYSPYLIAFYNPVLGGGTTAMRLIPVGWGEGYELAGAYLETLPDGDQRPAATWYGPALRPFAPKGTTGLSAVFKPGEALYAVLYIDQIQRRDAAEETDLLQQQTPLQTIWIHDIPYAQIYRIPPPIAQQSDASFGDLRLRGYDLDTGAIRSNGVLTVTLQWHPQRPIARNYQLFLHVFNQQGQRVGQVDIPPTEQPSSTWQVGSFPTSVQIVPLATDLPSGQYWVTLGIYDQATGIRLPLQSRRIADPSLSGSDALLLETFTLAQG
ncbi:MAG: hypothetical protein Fur005_45570 [Roseiflexaceae bacterium]